MSLEQLSKTVDFVQATTPSNANDGETYLDTSQSPPQLKVFDSNAGTFVQPRSIQNLDVPVSNAGETATDKNSTSEIATGVDSSTTASTVANNLDAKVSNAGETATDKNTTSEIATGVDNSATASTVNANLDEKVSNAGKTATDKNSTSEIATGVDNSTTASTVNTNLDAPVSSVGISQEEVENVMTKNISSLANSVGSQSIAGYSERIYKGLTGLQTFTISSTGDFNSFNTSNTVNDFLPNLNGTVTQQPANNATASAGSNWSFGGTEKANNSTGIIESTTPFDLSGIEVIEVSGTNNSKNHGGDGSFSVNGSGLPFNGFADVSNVGSNPNFKLTESGALSRFIDFGNEITNLAIPSAGSPPGSDYLIFQTNNSVTITSQTISVDTSIASFESLIYNTTNDNSFTFDLLDNNNNVLLSNISSGGSLQSISYTGNVKIRVNANNAKGDKVNTVQLAWLA